MLSIIIVIQMWLRCLSTYDVGNRARSLSENTTSRFSEHFSIISRSIYQKNVRHKFTHTETSRKCTKIHDTARSHKIPCRNKTLVENSKHCQNHKILVKIETHPEITKQLYNSKHSHKFKTRPGITKTHSEICKFMACVTLS